MVSAVVDFQPSGTTFDRPLFLDFCVGETLDDDDKHGAEDSGRTNDLGCTERDEYMSSLRDTYKVRCVAGIVFRGWCSNECLSGFPVEWFRVRYTIPYVDRTHRVIPPMLSCNNLKDNAVASPTGNFTLWYLRRELLSFIPWHGV